MFAFRAHLPHTMRITHFNPSAQVRSIVQQLQLMHDPNAATGVLDHYPAIRHYDIPNILTVRHISLLQRRKNFASHRCGCCLNQFRPDDLHATAVRQWHLTPPNKSIQRIPHMLP
ncbi:hypothetical protein RHDC4_02279 [Rhodocyclaceae bacterium]|nr:hypothetical protein RHDC4_02279 [Rhodocyclaceae bacterium]